MVKKVLAGSILSLILMTSCTKETETTVVTDGTGDSLLVVETTTSDSITINESEAKAKLDQAKIDLEAAIANGDKAAEEAARKTFDEARTAWENLKLSTIDAANDVNKAANDFKVDVDSKVQDVKSDVKQATENTKTDVKQAAENTKADINKAANDTKEGVNKAAENTKESLNKAKEDTKEGINNTLDKLKVK